MWSLTVVGLAVDKDVIAPRVHSPSSAFSFWFVFPIVRLLFNVTTALRESAYDSPGHSAYQHGTGSKKTCLPLSHDPSHFFKCLLSQKIPKANLSVFVSVLDIDQTSTCFFPKLCRFDVESVAGFTRLPHDLLLECQLLAECCFH